MHPVVKYIITTILVFNFYSNTIAQTASVSVNADIVNLYIWRGGNVNDMPNIQPSLTLQYGGLKGGFWGSYGLTHTDQNDIYHPLTQEIDTWLSYTIELPSSLNFTAIVTDYYYANSGIKIGNYNNYDNINGPGAHLLEAGFIAAGPASFPLNISGYVNFYNDKGNNIYLQVDYSLKVSDVGLNFFIGGTPGSKDNPVYYGTDEFNVINAGIKASKEIKITDSYSVPVSCSYVLNPRLEISYLVFGITL